MLHPERTDTIAIADTADIPIVLFIGSPLAMYFSICTSSDKFDSVKILICRRGLTEPCFDGDTINLRRRAQAISFKPITVQMHKLVLGTVISSKSKDQHHERKANDSLFFKEENSLG